MGTLIKELLVIIRIPLVIFPIMYFLYYLMSQGHFTH